MPSYIDAIYCVYRETDGDLHTSANVCYHYIENCRSSESQVSGGESVTSHTLQIYEEIDRSNDV